MKKLIITTLLLCNIFILGENKNIKKISVTGTVEREINPNIATISFEVTEKNISSNKSKEEVEKKITNFKNDLKKNKINFKNFETINFYTQKNTEYFEDFKGIKPKENTIKENPSGYNVNLTFSVKTLNFQNLFSIGEFEDENLIQSIVKNYDDDLYSFSINEQDSSIDSALNKAFKKFNNIKDKFIKNNISENDIFLNDYVISEIFNNKNSNNEKEYYTSVHQFKITTEQIKKLNNIISIAADNSINIYGNIKFNLTNKEDIESQMYNEAFEQTKLKAESILKSSNMVLVSPLVISEDVNFQQKIIDRIDENWSMNTDNYNNVAPLAHYSATSLRSAKMISEDYNSPKIDYKPKPIKITQNISVMYEIKNREEK